MLGYRASIAAKAIEAAAKRPQKNYYFARVDVDLVKRG